MSDPFMPKLTSSRAPHIGTIAGTEARRRLAGKVETGMQPSIIVIARGGTLTLTGAILGNNGEVDTFLDDLISAVDFLERVHLSTVTTTFMSFHILHIILVHNPLFALAECCIRDGVCSGGPAASSMATIMATTTTKSAQFLWCFVTCPFARAQ